jgi:ATP-dependent Clp protease ATP-binding subunit ClpB
MMVEEPTVEDTISILRGIKEKYELHHGVRISTPRWLPRRDCSARYITDRFLPDKAIDLVDEAASRLRMEVDSKPEELDALDRQILQMQIEAEALKKETDAASADRLEKLERELADLQEQSAQMTARWQAERDKLSQARDVKEQLDRARAELDQVKREGNLARAGELSYGIIPGLEKQLAEAEEAEDQGAMVEEAVRPEQIAEVVERWTGMPTSQDARRRARETAAHGRGPGHKSGDRAEGRGDRRVQRGAPRARRPARTRTAPWARSCFWGRPASARPN